jgi:hypothetical protein
MEHEYLLYNLLESAIGFNPKQITFSPHPYTQFMFYRIINKESLFTWESY